jgi:protocatechuate 3,4-dioxygenase beta subunit
VLTSDCRPVRRALLDFWQADDAGQYDNQGYRLRGHQFSDAEGGWRLETVVPGLYTGRTRHIHVKVQAPDGPVLTTQLYFPGEPANDRDGLFDQALLMDVSGDRASFTFVLAR